MVSVRPTASRVRIVNKRPLAAVLGLVAVGLGAAVAFGLFRARPVASPVVVVPEVKARQAVSVPAVRFTDVTAAAGVTFTHHTGAAGDKLLPETMGAGVAVLDYDGDGRPDLYFVNSCPWPGAADTAKPCGALYRNQGDGTFADVTEAAGLADSFYGVGACVGDYDNDGRPDLFVTAVGGDRLFRNLDGRRFADVTQKAGVGGPGGWPAGLTAKQFRRHAAPVPFGTSATFVDFDGDGRLDLFVGRYATWSPATDLRIAGTLTGIGRAYQQPKDFEGSQNALYRNRGDGTFADVSATAGAEVWDREGTGPDARRRAVGKTLGVVACDPDADGWPDLIVANDTVRNFLLRNVPDGAGGRRFEEQGELTQVAYADGVARGAMGIDAAEYVPGKLAVAVANFATEPTTFLTVNGRKPLSFADRAVAVGLAGPSRSPLKFGTLFWDYDLDGRPDLLTANGHIEPDIQKVQASQTHAQAASLFWNTGDAVRVFEPVTAASAGPDLFRPVVGRGLAVADFDADGDEDVVITANGGPPLLLRNDQQLGHRWVRLLVRGDGVRSSRDAFGAEVTVTAGGRTLKRWVAGGRGYLGQSEPVLTVGLGPATTVEAVTVRWPGKDAGVEGWKDLAVGRTHELKQGTGAPAK